MELSEKIKLLRASGVRKFKDAEIEIEFEVIQLAPEPPAPEKFPPGTPPEIINPDLMSEDKVRDWSASPSADGEGEALPMTGDHPLDGGNLA